MVHLMGAAGQTTFTCVERLEHRIEELFYPPRKDFRFRSAPSYLGCLGHQSCQMVSLLPLRWHTYLDLAENSRAPSYFSKFFEEQIRQSNDGSGNVRTLYIDRDTSTFQDIARHLQGISPPLALLAR